MAQGNRLEVDVVANIRAAQKQIEALTSRPYTLNLNTKGRSFDAPLGKIKGQLGEFEKSLEASNARVIAFGASASAIYAVNTALKESVKAAIEVEKSLADINVILNLSQKSLSQFGQSLFDIAKNTGNSFATVASAATELSRQGLGVSETLKRTQDALILTRLSGLDAVSSVEALTASLNGFQKAALTSTDIINKFAAVDASFAVSSADLAEAVKRVGSSAEDAGVSLDQLIAIVTATQQITARGGAVIGNSFKTIFTRLQRTETLDALQQLGIQTQTTEGSIRPLMEILGDLAKTYDSLNDVQRSAIAEQVGGVFQINILKAALGDLNKEYSIYSNALGISTGATDEAIKRNEQLNNTLASLLNKTIANLTAAGAKIGELSLAPALKKVFGGLNTILESFTGGDSEDVGNKIGEGLLKGLGNFLSGPGLIIGAKVLFNIFERLTVFTADALKGLTGLNAKGAEQAQLQQQIFSILQKNPEIIAQINTGQTTLKGLQESILTTIKAQTLAMEQQVTLSKSLAASLSSAGVSISKTGLTTGRLQAKAGGFVPNLFDQEESNARKMGASNPKAQISSGTIGGQKFIKNNKELEIVGVGSNGDSAVIPTYGSVGNQRQKELYDKMQFLGFIPNFAGGFSIGTQAYKSGIKREDLEQHLKGFSLSKEQQAIAIDAFEKKSKSITGTKTIPASNVTVLSSYRGTKNDAVYFKDGERVRFTGIQSAVPQALLPSDEGNFDTIIQKHLPEAIRGMANDLLGNKSKGFPDNTKIFNDMMSDKSAYPQIAGRIFETVISTAINKGLGIGEKGNRTWDYSPADFEDKQIVDALFGPDAAKLNNPYIDSKRSPVGEGSTNETLKSKLFNTPYFAQKIKSAKAMARGFIPNFAGIKDAMDTEKKMGGNPALDFEEGIGLYVRDRKTQPNFSAVKRDHPEGMGQAIKNSQKAQEALARGFIPNFAPLGIGNIGGGLKKALDDEAIPQSLKKLKDNAFGVSISLSTLSGVLESFNKDNKSAFGSVISEVTKAASTFASIATVIPGPVGLIAGAAIGVVQAMDGISKILNDHSGPITAALEAVSENKTKFSDAGQRYMAAFEKLSNIEARPEEYGTVEQATRTKITTQNEMAQAIQDMPPAMRDELLSVQTLTDMRNKYAEILGKAIEKEGSTKVTKDITDLSKDKGFTGTKGLDPEKAKTLAEQLLKSGGTLGGKQAAERFKEKAGMGGLNYDIGIESAAKNLSDLGVPLESIAGLGDQQLLDLNTALKEQAIEAYKASQAAEEDRKKLADKTKANREAEQENQRRIDQIKAEAEATQISAETTRLSILSEIKLANVRKSNIARIAAEAAKSELQTAQPFLTPTAMAKSQAGIETYTRTANAQTEKRGLVTEAIDKMSADFSNSIQKMIDDDKTTQAKRQELQQAKGQVSDIIKKGGTPEEISKKLEDLGKNLNLNNLISLQSQSSAYLQQMRDGMKSVDEELKIANQISEKQLAEQLKQIRNEQRLKTLGGMQGFINPETLKDPIEKALSGMKQAQMGGQYGLPMTKARGLAQAGMATLELTGGAGSEKLNKSLKGTVVPQQAEFIRQTFEDLAKQAESMGTPEGKKMAEVYREQAADATNIAATQFDAAFQKEQLPQNVAKILQEVQKMNGGGGQADAVKEGIQQAGQTQQNIGAPTLESPALIESRKKDLEYGMKQNLSRQAEVEASARDLNMQAFQGTPGAKEEYQAAQKELQDLKQQQTQYQKEYQALNNPQATNASSSTEKSNQPQKGRPEKSQKEETGLSAMLNAFKELQDSVKTLANAGEKIGKETAEKPESTGEIGVTFTPITIDVKGSIETENNELNDKMMAAITKAVEQIAPGILSKLKGPPIQPR